MAEEAGMRPGVVADLVPLGGDARGQLRMARHAAADQVEGRADVG
jgi:hypothetical protein